MQMIIVHYNITRSASDNECLEKMKFDIVILFTFFGVINGYVYENSTSTLARQDSQIHSRQKRYLIFPKGSSLQLVYCNTYLLRPVVDIFRFGTTAGLAWMLPHESSVFVDKKKHKIFKRSVFQKLEALIQTRGNGKHCILRALCESGQRTPSKKSFIREIIHTIFSVDNEEEEWETNDDKIYRRAHRSVNQNCALLYPDCTFSIFDYI